MLNSTTFRVLHWTATVIMAVMIAMYCYLQHIQRLTVRDKLYEVRQLTPRTWLYITEYAEPDTTTGDVYRYFLASKFDGDPLEGLENSTLPPRLQRTRHEQKLMESEITSLSPFTAPYTTLRPPHFFMMLRG